LEISGIFKNKAKEEGANITDIEILMVLIIRLLRRDLNKLVNRIELVELWDKG
jgi:hypothetical protein